MTSRSLLQSAGVAKAKNSQRSGSPQEVFDGVGKPLRRWLGTGAPTVVRLQAQACRLISTVTKIWLGDSDVRPKAKIRSGHTFWSTGHVWWRS
jgi:hypothetical protein